MPTLVAIGVLGLGIGSFLFAWEIVDTAVFHPVKGASTRDVCVLHGAGNPPGHDRLRWWERSGSFEALALYRTGYLHLRLPSRSDQEMVAGAAVTSQFFSVLGTQLSRDSDLLSAKQVNAREGVPVYVSQDYWRVHLGSPRFGTPLWIDGKSAFLAGVVLRPFHFPGNTDVWEVVNDTDSAIVLGVAESEGGSSAGFIGKLRPGWGVPRAEAALHVLQLRVAHEARTVERIANFQAGVPIYLTPVNQTMESRWRDLELNVLLMTFVMFALTCANASGLGALRALRRRGQVATELALGARKRDIASVAIWESLSIAGCAGSCGFLAAWIVIGAAHSTLSKVDPVLASMSVDSLYVWVAAGLTIATAIILAGTNLLGMSRVKLLELTQRGRNIRGRTFGITVKGKLVLAQVLLSFCLLAVCLETVSQLRILLNRPLGFDPNPCTVATLQSRQALKNPYDSAEEVLRSVRTRFGTVSAAVLDREPMSRGASAYLYLQSATPGQDEIMARVTRFAGDFAKALGIPVLAGSVPQSPGSTVVINLALARRLGFGTSAYTPSLKIDGELTPRTISAVVGNVRSSSSAQMLAPEMYLSLASTGETVKNLALVVGGIHGHRLSANAVLQAMRSGVSPLRVENAESYRAIIGRSLDNQFMESDFLGALAAVALLICASGLYAFLGYALALRSKEFAIKQALGSGKLKLLADIAVDSITSATIAIAGGATALVVLKKWIQHILPGGGWTPEPLVYSSAIILGTCVVVALGSAFKAIRGEIWDELRLTE